MCCVFLLPVVLKLAPVWKLHDIIEFWKAFESSDVKIKKGSHQHSELLL